MEEIKILVCVDKGVTCVRSDNPNVKVEYFDMGKMKRDGFTRDEIEADWDMRMPSFPHSVKEV